MLHGLSKLLQTIEMVSRRLNPTLKLAGVVLCQYESATRLASEVGQNVAEYFESQRDQQNAWSRATLFQTRIRRNIRLAECEASDNRFLNMLPIVTGRKIIGGWRKKWCRLRLRGSPRVREYGRSTAGEEFKPFYTVMLVMA